MAAEGASYAEIAAQYELNQQRCKHAAEEIHGELEKLCRAVGVVEPAISARTKSPLSVVQKICVRGKAGALPALTDLAAARVEVAFETEIDALVDAIEESDWAEVRSTIRRSDDLGPQTVGYLDVQLNVVPHGHTLIVDGEEHPLVAEIQLRTRAQGAWAVVQHELGYKQVDMTPSQERRLFRVMALVEMMDEQFGQLEQEIWANQEFVVGRAINAASAVLLKYTAEPFSRPTSLQLVPLLLPLYTEDELKNINEVLRTFDSENSDHLENALTLDSAMNPLIRQPESILILERLDTDAFNVGDLWPDELPRNLLEQFVVADGRPATAAAIAEPEA